ncbi:MAG: peptide chain release factor N(5)-glutamine methyltransferase [Bryobacteraceae bacterium]
MKVETALRQGLDLLTGGGIGAPALTSEVLLTHALHRDRVYLLTHPEHELSEMEWIHYGRFLHERLQGKPTQYITHTQEFWGRDFHVEEGVLIPRPETEHVVEAALALLPKSDSAGTRVGGAGTRVGGAGTRACRVDTRVDAWRILDIGTGSGILAVTLVLETKARACATEISPDALRIARANAARLGAQVDFVQCDLGAAFDDASLDLIVSNPPYIATAELATLQREVRDWEPRAALDGGADGLAVYRRLIPEAARLLRPGGWLILEIGATQAESVASLLGQGWKECSVIPDLAGLPRVVKVQWSP